MGLIELAGLAKSRLISMAMAGTLGPREMWLACKGATTYLAAVTRGEVAAEAVQERRAGLCSTCPEACREATSKEGVVAVYCGAAPGNGHRGPVCGCLVALTVSGRTFAAGKSVVSTQACPQRVWGMESEGGEGGGDGD